MGRKLYVGNFPYETGEAELQELFARAGTVETVKVMRDMATGRARGFAFVEMSTDEEAQKAIAELNEHQMGGRGLTVNEARPKPAYRAAAAVVTAAAIQVVAGPSRAGRTRSGNPERWEWKSCLPVGAGIVPDRRTIGSVSWRRLQRPNQPASQVPIQRSARRRTQPVAICWSACHNPAPPRFLRSGSPTGQAQIPQP